jgi:hypothetical protein
VSGAQTTCAPLRFLTQLLESNVLQQNPQQAPNQALPEIIRVRALKGFRASVNGQFGIVNPGDVVEIPTVLAMEMRAANKAVMVDEDLKRQKAYLPERKKNAVKVGDPLVMMAEAVAKLTQLVESRLPAQAAPTK